MIVTFRSEEVGVDTTLTAWASLLHHYALHFPIVLPLVTSVVGVFARRDPTKNVRQVLRVLGWLTALFYLVASLSGWLALAHVDDSLRFVDHKLLAILTCLVSWIAAGSVEWGCRLPSDGATQRLADRWVELGGWVWWVAAFGGVGTAHWGGLATHPELLLGVGM